ncbi:MAG: NUDIX domain-containing protein [Tannerellaceae bacterium]|jgi:ADP-ribose pyrophosphatase YjhB (NUDIX family)|nr:NUDIX domain-containing protein [Tannerellaceae bacterium]
MPHPLQLFSYCPVCGAEAFVERNEKAKQCKRCGFTYYFNPSGSVGVFLRNSKGEMLIVRRAKEPAKGTLDLPGGFIDCFETAEDAVRREVREETGLAVGCCNYLFSLPNIYPYLGFEVHTIDLFFECEAESFADARAADDAQAILVVPQSELRAGEFGLHSVSRAVALYLERKQ